MKIKIISANVQAGARTQRYHHYLTRLWYHLSPFGNKGQAARWAQGLAECDWVALQEADSGSLRSAFQHQAHDLARAAEFGWCHHQTNRRVGKVLTSGNALLSHHEAHLVKELPLPGRAGRGVLLATYPLSNGEELVLAVTHLALRSAGRCAQVAFLSNLLKDFPHVILLGDFNAPPASTDFGAFRESGLRCAFDEPTYPSWAPLRCLDHIWVRGVRVLGSRTLPWDHSDHLAVETSISLPGDIVPPPPGHPTKGRIGKLVG